MRKDCRFREKVCHSCNTKGHIAKVCKKNQLYMMHSEDTTEFQEELFTISEVNAASTQDI